VLQIYVFIFVYAIIATQYLQILGGRVILCGCLCRGCSVPARRLCLWFCRDELPLINVQAALVYPGSPDPAPPGSGKKITFITGCRRCWRGGCLWSCILPVGLPIW